MIICVFVTLEWAFYIYRWRVIFPRSFSRFYEGRAKNGPATMSTLNVTLCRSNFYSSPEGTKQHWLQGGPSLFHVFLAATVRGGWRIFKLLSFMICPVEQSFLSCLLFAAPTAGPTVDGKVEGNKVTVTWKKIPRGQRGGCITHYTIYLEGDSRDLRTCKNLLSS